MNVRTQEHSKFGGNTSKGVNLSYPGDNSASWTSNSGFNSVPQAQKQDLQFQSTVIDEGAKEDDSGGSVAPDKDELMCEESEFGQEPSTLELPSTESNPESLNRNCFTELDLGGSIQVEVLQSDKKRESLQVKQSSTWVLSNLDEDPKELKKSINGIVKTEAMHHVMFFYPPPEGNTHIPELEIVVSDVRWKRVVEGSKILMESLDNLNAYKVFEEMPNRENGLPKPWVVIVKLVLVYEEARTMYATAQRRLNFPSLIGHYTSSFVFDPGGVACYCLDIGASCFVFQCLQIFL